MFPSLSCRLQSFCGTRFCCFTCYPKWHVCCTAGRLCDIYINVNLKTQLPKLYAHTNLSSSIDMIYIYEYIYIYIHINWPLHTYIVFEHMSMYTHAISVRPKQDGRHFPDDIFKSIFLNENVWISIKISLKFVPRGPLNNIPALVQIMAWRRPGDKPLSKPMVVRLPTHICVTRPEWVKIQNTTVFIFHVTWRCKF